MGTIHQQLKISLRSTKRVPLVIKMRLGTMWMPSASFEELLMNGIIVYQFKNTAYANM
jgi:hypothetical protein